MSMHVSGIWNVCFLGTDKLAVLQEQWAACSGNWAKSDLYMRMQQRTMTRTKGARTWLTRPQVAQRYQSQEIADSICNAKLEDAELKSTHTKPHPDAPQNPEP